MEQADMIAARGAHGQAWPAVRARSIVTTEQEQRLLAYFEKFISNCRHVSVDPSEAAVELQI